jgi:hypothetical protein
MMRMNGDRLPAAVASATKSMLTRLHEMDPQDRTRMLCELHREIEQVLVSAATGPHPVFELSVRAQLAAAFNEEITGALWGVPASSAVDPG